MKKSCLSEEVFEIVSYEESHYERRSFDRKACRISPAFANFGLASRMTKNSILQNSYRRQKNEEISNLTFYDINTFCL